MSISELTPAQQALLPKYVEMGISIGLAVDTGNFNAQEVREITDAHRVMCGKSPAKNFHVFDSPAAALRDPRFQGKDAITPSNALYGQHDIGWLVNYLFFRVELGLTKETEGIIHLLELAKRCGWMWMGEHTTIVTRRPKEIHLVPKANSPMVLHNPSDFAMKYWDGEGFCALNGLRIPAKFQHFILDRSTCTPKAVFGIPNTEIRGEIVRMLGPEFMHSHLQPKTLHKAEVKNGGNYELYSVNIEGQTRVYLTGVCPSKGNRWHEAVPPECSKVEQALLWREWGVMQGTYLPPVIRT